MAAPHQAVWRRRSLGGAEKKTLKGKRGLNNLSAPSETSDILSKNTCRFFSLIWNGSWHCPLFPTLNMLVFASRTGSLMLTWVALWVNCWIVTAPAAFKCTFKLLRSTSTICSSVIPTIYEKLFLSVLPLCRFLYIIEHKWPVIDTLPSLIKQAGWMDG